MKTHTHPCERCQQPFPCSGALERNHDGLPETICDLFHVTGKGFRRCEACVMTAWCDDCGEHPVKTEIDGDRLCLSCADARTEAKTA